MPPSGDAHVWRPFSSNPRSHWVKPSCARISDDVLVVVRLTLGVPATLPSDPIAPVSVCEAPLTALNMYTLARKNFFKGLTFQVVSVTNLNQPMMTTPRDVGMLFERLYAGTLLSSDSTNQFMNLLKAQKVIDLQRIRGGLFEYIVSCRFPWIEVGWGLENYPKYFKLVSGLDWTLDDFWTISDRIYSVIKLFWLREYPQTDRKVDYPPAVWFDPANADTEGPIAGRVLEYDKYDGLLQHYYDLRGYDRRGIPTRATLERLGLAAEGRAAEKFGSLT